MESLQKRNLGTFIYLTLVFGMFFWYEGFMLEKIEGDDFFLFRIILGLGESFAFIPLYFILILSTTTLLIWISVIIRSNYLKEVFTNSYLWSVLLIIPMGLIKLMAFLFSIN